MQKRGRAEAAKWIGIAASLVAVALWITLAYMNQFYPEAYTQATLVSEANMIFLAAVGMLAAAFKRPFLMLLVFLISFFPVGLYVLGVPSVFRLIGIANLLFAVSGGLILSTRYRVVRT